MGSLDYGVLYKLWNPWVYRDYGLRFRDVTTKVKRKRSETYCARNSALLVASDVKLLSRNRRYLILTRRRFAPPLLRSSLRSSTAFYFAEEDVYLGDAAGRGYYVHS